MLHEQYFCDGHLTDAAFAALDEQTLTMPERELLLAHLESCPVCMERWLDGVAAQPLSEPPAGMEERILDAVSREGAKRKQGRIRVIQFTKLAIAVCLTMMLTVGVLPYLAGLEQKQQQFPNAVLSFQEQIELQKEEGRAAGQKNASLDAVFDSLHTGFRQMADFINFGGRDAAAEWQKE